MLDDHGAASGTGTTQDYWFRYDAMNRVVTDKGSLSGTTIYLGWNGTDYLYDAAGERVQATRETIFEATILDPDYDPGDPGGGGGPINYAVPADPDGGDVPQSLDALMQPMAPPGGGGGGPGSGPTMLTSYDGPQIERYTYDAAGNLQYVYIADSGYIDNLDGTVTVTAPADPGKRKATYVYDLMGRLTHQTDWQGDGSIASYARVDTFDAAGRVTSETSTQKIDSDTWTTVVTNTYGTGASYALGAVVSSSSSTSKNGSFSSSLVTTNTLTWYQSALTTHASYSANNGGTVSSYSDSYGYDGGGALTSISVGGTHAHTVALTNDVSGMAIRRDESDASSAGEPHEVWYRFNGREVGYDGNNGSDDQASYQSSITDRTYYYQQGTGAFRNGWASGAI